MAPPRIPRATYRLQFNKDFTFAHAEGLVPYFASLGISHLYASPLLKARAGSTHGYDIIDHSTVNPELGGEAAFERLVQALARHDMGLVIDVVPNHMGVGGADNAWWLDVLEWGRQSPYAMWFDIDWQSTQPELTGKILLPFLGDHYGSILKRGELVPRFDRNEGTVSVWYWDHRFPIDPGNYGVALRSAAEELRGTPEACQLSALLDDFGQRVNAGRSAAAGTAQAEERRRQGAALKRRLAELTGAHDAIDRALAALVTSVEDLHALLERQSYLLAFWRTAADQINYRRFFDINDLAGLRMEDPRLFELAHRKISAMLAAGQIHGLRIDHVDGLYNPAQYCRELQSTAAVALQRPAEEQPVWLVVEKILAFHERLRRDWPVAGTTGYDFCNQVLGLFIDHAQEGAIDEVYTGFAGQHADFETEVYAAKKKIITQVMTSELNVLAAELARLAASHWQSRDFTLVSLAEALTEVVACFPVYRTYVTARRVTDLDRRYIGWAVSRARKLAPQIDAALFDFVHAILDTSAARRPDRAYDRRAVIDFAMSLQQYTGPVTAKGYEDTALYRYNRLIALNEVGGDPQRFGLAPGRFHQAMRSRQRSRPHSMLATATHDTKRGEDVRVRLAAVSEMPAEWGARLERWGRLNVGFKGDLADGPAPTANDEIFLYQTLLGAWPMEGPPEADFADRLEAVLVKSLREAKQRTSWGHVDTEYEQASTGFLRRILERGRHNPFLDDFVPFQQRLARLGMVNSLGQTLLRMTVPGVPDFYQGTELWQLSLVDPDNRRPVDWERRIRFRGDLAAADPAALLADWCDGKVKMDLIRRVLEHRRDDPELYEKGAYQALVIRGELRAHLLAFARLHEGRGIIVVVSRLLAGLWPEGEALPPRGAIWRGLFVELPKSLAAKGFRDLLTGDSVEPVTRRGSPCLAVEAILMKLPVSLLLGV